MHACIPPGGWSDPSTNNFSLRRRSSTLLAEDRTSLMPSLQSRRTLGLDGTWITGREGSSSGFGGRRLRLEEEEDDDGGAMTMAGCVHVVSSSYCIEEHTHMTVEEGRDRFNCFI
ncbi:hypothetical protein BHE74_00022424 [Ensete ventricosum]|nr:hypothetical protein GW17_00025459 [Ensete ventricosum]RWW69942.1 hypothetical protein BHE74_00022424 [Ensete ventricosum]RZS00692.1 hypothetical protein BHM03_00030452 [Ensete ventricosum]